MGVRFSVREGFMTCPMSSMRWEHIALRYFNIELLKQQQVNINTGHWYLSFNIKRNVFTEEHVWRFLKPILWWQNSHNS